MIVTICSAIKKDGAPCAAKTILESEYCMSHHPESAEWRSKGGRNKSNIARAHNRMPDGLRPIVDGLLTGFQEVHSGDLEPRQLASDGTRRDSANQTSRVCFTGRTTTKNGGSNQ